MGVVNRELDEKIATTLFGLVPCQATLHRSEPWPCYAQPESPAKGGELRWYSTDIAEAWTVVEKMEERGFGFRLHRCIPFLAPWYPENRVASVAYFTPNGTNRMHIGTADSPAEAICEAALAALTSEQPVGGVVNQNWGKV